MTASYVDNTDRFTGRAQSYTKYRPGYSTESIDFVKETLPIMPGDKIIDLGSGTGILSALLLKDLRETLNVSVWGVEPNADMRAEQDIGLSPWADKGAFQSISGTAEATTLPDQSADIAVAAAAFHWFDGPSTRIEVKRVVRSRHGKGAPMAILTTNPSGESVPPEFEHAREAMLAFREMRGRVGMTHTFRVHEEKFSEAALDAFFGGRGQWTIKDIPAVRKMTWDQCRGLIHSFSTAPREGTPEHDRVIEELQKIFDKYQIDGELETLRASRIVYGYVK